ncbi:MAG: phage major capsid protein [Actinomycetota bacterium]|nr:phage major capsid protein [Actinomycetota bacterium]
MSALKDKSIVELRGRLNEINAKMHEVLEQAGENVDMSKVTTLEGDSAAKVEQLRALNDEATDLGKELDERREIAGFGDRIAEQAKVQPHPGHPTNGKGDRAQPVKSLGELFVESSAYTGRDSLKTGRAADLDVDFMAALFETGAGWAPPAIRGPKVVEFATRPLRVVDLIPGTTTTAVSIVYMEETTFTNAAVEVAEGSAKPEAALVLTERTDAVRKIAVWLPVTDEQLEDIPRIRGYLDNRLGFMVRQRLDAQILVGNGTAPNLRGILNRTGIQTQAKGADPTPDAVYKAMIKVRTIAFAEPNAAVFHPLDWQDIRLLKTADGIYIWGSPADAGPERIWGLRVVLATALTENTGLVGDFEQTELAVKKGVTLDVSDSHSDFFVNNKQAVRAEMRAALAVYRPAAFCSVTGI